MAYRTMGTGREYPARATLAIMTLATIGLWVFGKPVVFAWLFAVSMLLPASFMPPEWYMNMSGPSRKEGISRWLRTYRRAFLHPGMMHPGWSNVSSPDSMSGSAGGDGLIEVFQRMVGPDRLGKFGAVLVAIFTAIVRAIRWLTPKPSRMSWWWAVAIALVSMVPPQGWPIATGAMVYWMAQSAFAAARLYKFEGEELPMAPGDSSTMFTAWTAWALGEGKKNIAKAAVLVALCLAAVGAGGVYMHLSLAHWARWPKPIYHDVRVLRDWQPWTWPIWIWPVAGLALGLLATMYRPSRQLVEQAQAPWLAERQEREMWMQRWMACKVPPPMYQLKVPYPINTFNTILFQVSPGTPIEKYESVTGQMASMLGTSMIVIAPTVGRDEQGMTTASVSSPSTFELSWAQVPLGATPAINPQLDKLTRKFVTKCAFRQAFVALRLGAPMFDTVEPLAGEDQRLWRAKFWLAPGCTVEQVVKREAALREKIGCEWMRIALTGDEHSITIIYGDSPMDLNLSELDPEARLYLQRLQWDGWFRASKIYNPMGATPRLIQQRVNERGLTVADFEPVDGLSVDAIKVGKDSLIPSINRAYVEIESTDTAGAVRITFGESDPLDRAYLYMDYETDLLRDRAARADITFFVGVGADGELIRFDHDSVVPHVIVAGSSGMGKSTLLHSMITQMAYKNSPEQWNLWIADPKNEMQRYINLPHVTHFIDMNSIRGTGDSVYSTLADMLGELVEEMERRYSLFQQMPGRPQKLSQARAASPEVAQSMPYITCLVEECADYFAPPALKVYKEDYERMVFNAELLARKARGAGIYLVMATQRPTKQSVPSVIKGQSSRIGFGCPDKVSSMVVIDQPGLEAIRTRGRGLVVTQKGYQGFRAFYMQKPDEDHPDVPDDVEVVLGKLGISADEEPQPVQGQRQMVPPPSPDQVWGTDSIPADVPS